MAHARIPRDPSPVVVQVPFFCGAEVKGRGWESGDTLGQCREECTAVRRGPVVNDTQSVYTDALEEKGGGGASSKRTGPTTRLGLPVRLARIHRERHTNTPNSESFVYRERQYTETGEIH